MNKYYTGVGSRETPSNVMEMMTKLATILAGKGYILRSGGAHGADMAFESGAKLKEIYLPWGGFNNNESHLVKSSKEAFDIASKIHPAWWNLSHGAKKLHARNIHQVLGQDLKTPSDFLVCWTKEGKEVGGTATAIKIARQNNIPIYNLFFTTSIHKLMSEINKDTYD